MKPTKIVINKKINMN